MSQAAVRERVHGVGVWAELGRQRAGSLAGQHLAQLGHGAILVEADHADRAVHVARGQQGIARDREVAG